jgi:hypothetical protein
MVRISWLLPVTAYVIPLPFPGLYQSQLPTRLEEFAVIISCPPKGIVILPVSAGILYPNVIAVACGYRVIVAMVLSVPLDETLIPVKIIGELVVFLLMIVKTSFTPLLLLRSNSTLSSLSIFFQVKLLWLCVALTVITNDSSQFILVGAVTLVVITVYCSLHVICLTLVALPL